MQLTLSKLPESLQHYTGKPVPAWMRYLHPEAASSILRIETETGGLSYTDLFRTAEVSLHAVSTKRGVQPPGFSAHNFGLAIDFDIDGTLKKQDWTYPQFLAVMEGYGWYCHRRDGKGGSESWHLNYFGPTPKKYLQHIDPKNHHTWAAGVEARIRELYADQFKMNTRAVQTALKELKMFHGDIDGRIGPVTKQAVIVFQRAWGLEPDGMTGPLTQRTLAFVTATKNIVPPRG